MMELPEGLIVAAVKSLGGEMKLPYGDQTVDFTPPWKRATYAELFGQYVGVGIDDVEGCRRAAEATGFPTAGKHPDVMVHQLFEETLDENLTGPTCVQAF